MRGDYRILFDLPDRGAEAALDQTDRRWFHPNPTIGLLPFRVIAGQIMFNIYVGNISFDSTEDDIRGMCEPLHGGKAGASIEIRCTIVGEGETPEEPGLD